MPPPVTAVEEEPLAVRPTRFALEQNVPNPFNGETVIRFALPERSDVELAIYNLVGQKVMTLVEGVYRAGVYTVAWDGRDTVGREVASGVYLYRLQAGERVEIRKIVLMK